MFGSDRTRPAMYLVVGLLLGIAAGSLFPHAPLHAVATDRFENFAICTAPADGETEALFFLDFITGELKAAVLNPQTGDFRTFFQRNILQDFGGEQLAKPRFLMISGMFEARNITGRPPTAKACVYVAELSGGVLCAYTIPWTRARSSQTAPANAPIVLLDKLLMRQPIRME